MATRVYPADGWLPPGAKFSWQHPDQGRDFVTNWAGIIQAPGDGYVVENGSDRPYPNGFGPSYPVVRIESGDFRGHTFYIGHCTSLVSPGERFGFGHALAKANQGNPRLVGVPEDGGWVELGEIQPDGVYGPEAPHHWFDRYLRREHVIHIPDKPLRYGERGLRVLAVSGNLAECGYLKRRYFTFNREVHGAVVAFKHHHHLPLFPPNDPHHSDRGIIDERTAAAIATSAKWCRRHHRQEVRP